MKEYINENGEKRLVSDPEGTDWLDAAYREAQKEFDEVVIEDIINTACNYVTKPQTPYTKEELIQNIQKWNSELPKPPTIQETIMWHRYMLKKMAMSAGITEEEMIQHLKEMDIDSRLFPDHPPADPTSRIFEKENKDE